MVSPPAYECARCPVCGSSRNRRVADRDAVRDEVARLWAFHERRLHAGVPPERLTDRVVFSQDPPLAIVECACCSHLYRNPWERREALIAAYDRTPPDEVLESLFATQRAACAAQVERLRRVAGPSGRGLEIGSYVGGFLAAAREQGWSFEGVDVSEHTAAFCARRGFTVTRGEITNIPDGRRYDAIAIWNTFEQLYDARQAVRAAHRRLQPGGILAVRVPNGRFYTRWRALLGGPLDGLAERLLAHNNLLGFPYRQAFTARSMLRLFNEIPFTIVQVFGDTLVPIADEWTTTFGAVEERLVKGLERVLQRAWHAPWVEVYVRRGSER